MSAQSVIQTYHQNNVMSADPLKLIIMMYDRAIYGCRQKDLEQTWNAIKMLIDSLNMEAKPIADNLLAIYDYCSELARKKEFDKAAMILQELRDTWASVKYET
ncbi:MAG: flagellar export chaperone FliS [Candidatus Poribacteria bacterium]